MMGSSTIQEEIVREVAQLPPALQRRVLEYARSLTGPRPGTPGPELLRFAGLIDPEDLRIMAEVIEEECERIDPAEW